jgi:hypothetical protein
MKHPSCVFAALMALCAGGAFAQGPGLYELPLWSDEAGQVGFSSFWNSPKKFHFKLVADSGYELVDVQAFVGTDIADLPVNKGKPQPGAFPFKYDCAADGDSGFMCDVVLDLQDDLGFSWGSTSADERLRVVAVHADAVRLEDDAELDVWAKGPYEFVPDNPTDSTYWYLNYLLAHPQHGQFIDSPVQGLSYRGPTQEGITGVETEETSGSFFYFPGETLEFSIGSVPLGDAFGAKKVSPLDLWSGADSSDPRVLGVARTLQTLDADSGAEQPDGKIVLLPEVVGCFESVAGPTVDWGDSLLVEGLLSQTVATCNGVGGAELALVSEADAQGNLEAGLNASGIFRKNLSKTEDLGENKQKLEVMPVYFPGRRSNGDPSLCVDANDDGIYDPSEDTLGVPYEEWRLDGDPAAEECDPRDYEDPLACQITLIECREVAKPIVVTYREVIDIYDDQVTTEFWPHRFSTDIFTAVSRDDGTTWKRMNVSRMADLTSFDLETGEPFPGTASSPYLKVNDNYILNVWESKFCKSGNPRYAIDNCEIYPDDCVDLDGDGTPESVCRGNEDQGTLVCEPDYPFDDEYYVTDIWGVRGHQQSVDYDEVDDVDELGIGEIPYSCLWAARGVIVSQRELDAGTFGSLTVDDNIDCTDVGVPYECCTGAGTGTCEIRGVGLGDVVWYKPERITSGRRDAYIPAAASARGAGFAIAWQEDPDGLRPGKGKGPGQGWSGAISNHKSDIWYTFLSYDDFAAVDENFVPGGPPESGGPDEKPGLGRPKALVPFALPVRVSDNDMVNTDTLKVEQSTQCVTPPNGTEPVCFPVVVDGTYVPLDPEEIASQFCGHPDADPATCCDPDDHEADPDCEDLKGLYGNMTGTKRYAYLAKTIDNDQDGVPDYQYYVDRGGTLDLCDTSGGRSYFDALPGSSARERWFGFTNVAGASKLVCTTSDGRLLDGDVSASRPNMQMQPYTKPDGTRSAWVLLGYEESKGMGHSLAASAHETTDETTNPVDDIILGQPDDPGQEKPIKQDLGKNVIYHSFDFTQPDLVSAGHIVNLPALCGGLYPQWCGEDYDGTNPTCTCELGEPVPLYFDRQECTDPNDPATCEWMPDPSLGLLQFRTEIARRVRFIMQSPGKMGASKTLGAIIYKQGQEGQGRPADVFIRRMVKSGTGNPYQFANFECSTYLDETFTLPACPNGAGDKPSATGYMCDVWGQSTGDRLCGGVFNAPYSRRDHVNLTSADIDLSVDAGPEDDTPDDPTDDVYGTDKVLLWTQNDYNLGDESYGVADVSVCDLASCPGMYSNARSHRGFIRGDVLVTAYAFSPNWAAARNGRDRYNFYTRRSFDGGQTWTTTPSDLGGSGVNFCREWRSDPTVPDDDGSGNAPPVWPGFDPECVDYCAPDDPECVVTGEFIAADSFEPARKVSQFDNNKETSSDPRVGATPPVYPLDGRVGSMPVLRFVEDEYVDNIFFVAWGGGDNLKSTGGTAVTPEAPPTDIWYTRTEDYGDHYLKVPWVIGGTNSNQGYGETVWRYDFLAKGDEEEQGECQLRATSDGSKVYAIYHQMVPAFEDEDAEITRWYPWEPEESTLNDLWFRRVIFWPEETPQP